MYHGMTTVVQEFRWTEQTSVTNNVPRSRFFIVPQTNKRAYKQTCFPGVCATGRFQVGDLLLSVRCLCYFTSVRLKVTIPHVGFRTGMRQLRQTATNLFLSGHEVARKDIYFYVFIHIRFLCLFLDSGVCEILFDYNIKFGCLGGISPTLFLAFSFFACRGGR